MIFGHQGHSSRGEITEDGSREQHHPSNKDIVDLIHKPEYIDIPKRKERRDKGRHKSEEHRDKERHKSEDYGITGRQRSHQEQRKPQEQPDNGNDFAKQTKTKAE